MFVRICLLIIFLAAGVAQAQEGGQWRPLFNGKDLSGWTPKITGYEAGENFADTFRVEDGMIKVRYDGYDSFDNRFGHLFYDEPFSSYRLRVEYRVVGDQCPQAPGWAIRNSGIMIHGQTPQSMTLKQSFPVSLEVQLLGGDGTNPRPTGNLCTPGTNVVMAGKLHTAHCKNSTSETYHGDQWVTAEVEARGNGTVRHYINGKLVMEYTEPQYDPKDGDAKPLIETAGGKLAISGGTISLQSEGHPFDFRKVEIKELAD
jgi:hypothetical protein